MTQLSRPFQIALVAVALLAVVWFVALHGHSTSSGGSSSSVAAVTPSPSSQATNPAGASPIYHGKAPGVEGLTKAIDKAHGAVAQSQQNATQLKEKSEQASRSTSTEAVQSGSPSSPKSAQPTTATASQPAAVTKVQPSTAAQQAAKHKATSKANGTSAVTGPNRTPAMQALVESELKHGKIAVLLFWNKKGADDVAVQYELQLLLAAHREIRKYDHVPLVRRLLKVVGLELNKKIAVHYASEKQVAAFGSFTRTVQVYQTPTIVIVNKKGETRTLTGLVDAYAIEQTIDEVRHSE